MSIVFNGNTIERVIYNNKEIKVINYKKGSEEAHQVWKEPHNLSFIRGEGIHTIHYKVVDGISGEIGIWNANDGDVTLNVGYGDVIYYYVDILNGFDNLDNLPTTEQNAEHITIKSDDVEMTFQAKQYHTITITNPSIDSSYLSVMKVERLNSNGTWSELSNGSHYYIGDKLKATITLGSTGYGKYTVKLNPGMSGGTESPLYLTSTSHSTWDSSMVNTITQSSRLRGSYSYTYPEITSSNWVEPLNIEFKAFETKIELFTIGYPKESEWKDAGDTDITTISSGTRPYYYCYDNVKLKFELWLTKHKSETQTKTLGGLDYSTTLQYGGYNVDMKVKQISLSSSDVRLSREERDWHNAYKSAIKVLGVEIPVSNES